MHADRRVKVGVDSAHDSRSRGEQGKPWSRDPQRNCACPPGFTDNATDPLRCVVVPAYWRARFTFQTLPYNFYLYGYGAPTGSPDLQFMSGDALRLCSFQDGAFSVLRNFTTSTVYAVAAVLNASFLCIVQPCKTALQNARVCLSVFLPELGGPIPYIMLLTRTTP